MIFPRLSPSGASWVAEGLEGLTHTIVVDGETIAREGIQPAWLSDRELVYADAHEAQVWRLDRSGLVLDVWQTAQPVNRLQAQDGHWCGWMPRYLGAGGYVRDGVPYGSAQEPALGLAGALWFPPDGAIEPRWNAAGRVAVQHPAPPHVTPQEWAPWPAVTHWAVPVWTPAGPWLLRLEDERLVLHPVGDPLGYVVARGVTRWPDARWDHEQIRVVWSTPAGVIESRHLALDASRIDVRPTTPPPPPPPPPPGDSMFAWDRVTVAPRSAQEIARWPITSALTHCAVRVTGEPDDVVTVEHSKAGRWPAIDTEAVAGVVEGTVWAALPLSDRSWRLGTFDWLRPGQIHKGMNPSQYGWGYALAFDDDYVVRPGDPVGYFVSTPARGDVRTLNERSGVVVIRYGTDEVLWREEGGTPPPPPTTTPPPSDLAARVSAIESWARGIGFRG